MSEESPDATEEYGVRDAVADGYLRVAPAGDPAEDPSLQITEHGEAAGRDALRQSDAAVAHVVELYVGTCLKRDGDDADLVHALAEITKFLAEDAGINAYRILRHNPDLAPWLADDAITAEMAQAVDEDWIHPETEPSGTATDSKRGDSG